LKKLKTNSLIILMAMTVLTFGVGDIVTTALFLNNNIEESEQTTIPHENIIKENNYFATWILDNFNFWGLVALKIIYFIFLTLFIYKCQEFPLTAIAVMVTITIFGVIATTHNLCILNEKPAILPTYNFFLYVVLFSVPPIIILAAENAKQKFKI